MKKVYVVMGTTGEYSDRNEWPVAAYMTEGQAAKRIVEQKRKAQEVRASGRDRHDTGWTEWSRNETGDPGFQMDYTGTDYFMMEVDLID